MNLNITIDQASLEADLIRAVKAVIIGACFTQALLPDLTPMFRQRVQVIAGKLAASESFNEDLTTVVRAAVLEGARLGALEEGRKIGVKIAKGAASLEGVQRLLPMKESL